MLPPSFPSRSPLELVESLRAALPATNPMTVQRRMALENVIQMLSGARGCCRTFRFLLAPFAL